MIVLDEYVKKARLPRSDYVVHSVDELWSIVYCLTPKFNGEWDIILLNPTIVEAKSLLDMNEFPNYVNCKILLQRVKLDQVAMEFPSAYRKQKTKYERYQDLIASLTHLIDKDAMKILYKNNNGDLDTISDLLMKLDATCEGDIITVSSVKKVCHSKPITYASDVVISFLRKDRFRWNKYKTLVSNLGEKYAYYAIFKQIRLLLKTKNDYLNNKDIKNFAIENIDAPFICYAYTLFMNNNNWRNLYAIMWALDNRGGHNIVNL